MSHQSLRFHSTAADDDADTHAASLGERPMAHWDQRIEKNQLPIFDNGAVLGRVREILRHTTWYPERYLPLQRLSSEFIQQCYRGFRRENRDPEISIRSCA
jgi:hypothetical protein